MRSSTSLIVLTFAAATIGCTSSTHQTGTTGWSRVTASEGLGNLMASTQTPRPEGRLHVAEVGEEVPSDLWMKKGSESDARDLVARPTPRLDWVLYRMTPRSKAAQAGTGRGAKALY